jgi:ABC-type enterochelin transport system substrate-binding protein
MLRDTFDKLPLELMFVGRNMNIIRYINKYFDSKVNRTNVMAYYAV